MANNMTGPVMPWWRVKMVWLVVGGPATVVVASFVTLGLAIHFRDPPLLEGAAAHNAQPDAGTPAELARNHAATPRH